MEPLQEPVGLHVVALQAEKAYLLAPKPFPIRIDFEQLVDIANGRGIVFGLFLHFDKQMLGCHILRVVTASHDEVITGVVVILVMIIILPVEFIQIIGFSIITKAFVEQALAFLPLSTLEHGTDIDRIVVGTFDVIGK